jgi:hypothetical protein
MNLVQIPGTSLLRDTNNMALISNDRNGLEEYLTKRRMFAAQKEEINRVRSEVDAMKTDLAEIKQLMVQLLNKG